MTNRAMRDDVARAYFEGWEKGRSYEDYPTCSEQAAEDWELSNARALTNQPAAQVTDAMVEAGRAALAECTNLILTTGELKAIIEAALLTPSPRYEGLVERQTSLLRQALEAIESGRSEPLFIMRDAIRNHLEDEASVSIEGVGRE
jgi:hypothetical protein